MVKRCEFVKQQYSANFVSQKLRLVHHFVMIFLTGRADILCSVHVR